MHYVYLLNSIPYPDKFYVGYTLDVHDRLNVHNEGGSVYTKDHRPWEVIFYCCFSSKAKALAFEKYLKTHSGRAFAQKRLS
jgi:putative endonuclease